MGISAVLPGQAKADEQVPMPRGRRRTELLMLIFAVAVVLFAYASVGLGLNGRLPAGLAGYGLAYAVIVFGAHLAVRRLAPWADPLMLPLAALLNGLGVVMIYRLQQSGRGGNPGNVISTITTSTTTMQIVFSAIGVAAFVARARRHQGRPGAAAVYLHARHARADPARHPGPAARQHQPEHPGRQGLDRDRRLLAPARASSPGWRSPCSSPATWWPSGTCWRWPAAGCSASTCPGPATSARC